MYRSKLRWPPSKALPNPAFAMRDSLSDVMDNTDVGELGAYVWLAWILSI
jgi:hypothetical protein